MTATSRQRDPGRPRSAAGALVGFSLIEVLISVGLLLLIALGILPLFTRAMVSNRSGLESTQVSNLARSRVEELTQLAFNDAQLTVPGGSTERLVEEHFSANDRDWKPGTTPDGGDRALFLRATRVHQYGIDDLTTPLDGSAPAAAVHLKEIVVTVQSARQAGGPLGAPKQITVRVFKSQ